MNVTYTPWLVVLSLIVDTMVSYTFAEARKARPDMILSGNHVFGVDTSEVGRRIQQDPELGHVPVVFLTAA